jgi:hypothetical protein
LRSGAGLDPRRHARVERRVVRDLRDVDVADRSSRIVASCDVPVWSVISTPYWWVMNCTGVCDPSAGATIDPVIAMTPTAPVRVIVVALAADAVTAVTFTVPAGDANADQFQADVAGRQVMSRATSVAVPRPR